MVTSESAKTPNLAPSSGAGPGRPTLEKPAAPPSCRCVMAGDPAKTGMEQGTYHRLAVMALLSFLSMCVLMYAMVDRYANVFSNLNQVYMAGLMTAPMVIIELVLMRGMYPRKGLEHRHRPDEHGRPGGPVGLHQAASADNGRAVPPVHDSPPRRGDTDVREGARNGRRDRASLQVHHCRPAVGDR